MAKPPPVETFNVTFENISIEALGPLMAAGIKLGHSDVHYNLVTTVSRFLMKNAPGASQTMLDDWTKEHPTFKAIEAVRHFETHGLSKTAAYPALGALIEKGILKKLAPGNYARTDVKALPSPKTKTAAQRKAAGKRHDVSHADYILKNVRRKGSFSREDVKALLKKDRRTPTSAGPTITVLLKRVAIERMSEGLYKVLPPQATNGAGVSAHG